MGIRRNAGWLLHSLSQQIRICRCHSRLEALQPLQQGRIHLIRHLIVGAVPGLKDHLGGGLRGMALEGGTATGGIDPGITDAPEQQQRRGQFREELVKGLTARDVEDGAEHPESAGIEGGAPDRLHQPVIDVGFVDIDLIEGAADRGGPSQVLEQQALQHLNPPS